MEYGVTMSIKSHSKPRQDHLGIPIELQLQNIELMLTPYTLHSGYISLNAMHMQTRPRTLDLICIYVGRSSTTEEKKPLNNQKCCI